MLNTIGFKKKNIIKYIFCYYLTLKREIILVPKKLYT